MKVKSSSDLKTVSNPLHNYDNGRISSNLWSKPEYDFGDIERLIDIDSYLAQSFQKKINLFFKEGYEFVGENEEVNEYIEKRLKQIARQSKTTVGDFIARMRQDLVKFSNVYILKVRNEPASGGYSYRDKISRRRYDPIAALFILPAPTVEVQLDKKGQVIKYRQYISGQEEIKKEFSPDQIIHIALNKKSGFISGTPRVTSVIEDIKALRRIEENVEILIVQNIFPIIHYKVGTEENPAREGLNGQSEVDDVTDRIRRMPPEGIFVTSERHDIQIKGTEGRALRVETYIEHFKKRVFAGLSMSGIDFGEGDTANRATAVAISQALIDEVQADQRLFEEAFNELIINELLKETGSELDLDDDSNLCYLRFGDIDQFSKIARENHTIQKWTNNLITQTEARYEMGYIPLEEESLEDMHVNRVTIPIALVSSTTDGTNAVSHTAANNPNTPVEPEDVKKASKELEKKAKQEAKTAMATKKAGASVKGKSGPSKSSASKSRPSNQYGTKTSPRRSVKDSLDSIYQDNLLADFSSNLKKLKTDKITTAQDKKLILSSLFLYREREYTKVSNIISSNYNDGFLSTGISSSYLYDDNSLEAKDAAKRYGLKYVDRIFNEVKKYIESRENLDIKDLFIEIDSIAYRVNFIRNTESMRAYNWGVVTALKELGEDAYNIDMNQDTDEQEKQLVGKPFPLREARISNIPPWHPNSTIKVKRVNQ